MTTTVACPHCRQLLTAHASPRAASRGLRLALTMLLGMAGVGCGQEAKPTRPASGQAGTPAAASRTPEAPKAKAEAPKPKKVIAAEPAVEPAAEPKKEMTFDEAYAEAEKLADAQDKAEPERTEKATKLLTGQEVSESRNYLILSVRQPNAIRDDDLRNGLTKYGLEERLFRLSREYARQDPKFKPTVRTIWVAKAGAMHINGMMSYWGQIDQFVRGDVVFDIANGRKPPKITPESRNAILKLGGQEWLEK